jgi:hypothetical protein
MITAQEARAQNDDCEIDDFVRVFNLEMSGALLNRSNVLKINYVMEHFKMVKLVKMMQDSGYRVFIEQVLGKDATRYELEVSW